MRVVPKIIILFTWLLWLIFLSPLYLLSWLPIFWSFTDSKEKQYELEDTICGLLFKKGLLSQEDYDFEHEQVGPNTSHFVFLGYIIQVWPLLRIMQENDIIDDMVLWATQRWIVVQRAKAKGSPIATLETWLEKISVLSAYLIGPSVTVIRVILPLKSIRSLF